MTPRGALVLRPEPGAGATAARLRDLGIDTAVVPLFAVRPLAWEPPDPAAYDALLLTSANAIRHGGGGLAALVGLPVIAVGAATAAAARGAGFTIAATGDGDVAAALALARPRRALHLTGIDHRAAVADRIAVYDSAALDVPPAPPAPRPRRAPPAALAAVEGRVALLHSPRAARRFAALARHDRFVIAALSPAVAAAAGEGWARILSADTPEDAALVALAAGLAAEPD